MNRKIVLCGLGILMGLVISGCDSGTSTPVTDTELLGKWDIKSSSEKGYTRITDDKGKELMRFDIDTSATYPANTYYVEFKTAGKYTANLPAEASSGLNPFGKRAAAAVVENGSWSLTGSTLVIVSDEGDTLKFKPSISGANGAFTMSVNQKFGEANQGGFESVFDVRFSAVKE